MNSRSLASLALGGLLLLGTTGCAAITHQATTIQYSPADGVNVPLGEDSTSITSQAKAWDAKHAPGTFFRYSNLNFPIIAQTKALPQLLGEVRERIANTWP